jgi:ParB/RepB/Spo0J family partition protein
MAKAKDDLRHLPINLVRPSEVALRSVDKESEKYQGLVSTVKQYGIINPVSVQEIKDTETGKTVYGLIDGLHRYSATIDAGLETIPAHIMEADEARRLELQIIGNLQVVETRAAEYSKQLHKLLALNPTMSTIELATKLGKSITWLNERLNLIKLTDEIQELVNNSTINITNAFNLAKLPQEEQASFVDRAMTDTPAVFVPTVSARTKQIRDAKRQGRQAEGPKPFEPPVHLQKLSDLKAELKTQAVGKGLINQYKITDALDAWKMAISYVLHLDPISVDVAERKENERKKLADEAKAKKKQERDVKKAKAAADVAAGLTPEEDDEDDDE